MRAKSTVYNGIKMRSRTEARFAKFLDDRSVRWEYEIQKFCASSGCYLPDFLIEADDGRGIWVEVKPTMEQALEARTKMERILETYPDASMAVVIPVEAGLRSDGDIHDHLCDAFELVGCEKRTQFFFAEAVWVGDEHWAWFGSEDGHDGRIGNLKLGREVRKCNRR